MQVSEVLERIRIPSEKRFVSVRPAEGEFMHRWIKDHQLCKTLEVGFAYGASAACIMSAHPGVHTCIDPFQENHENLGLQNIESLGYGDRLVFHPGFSCDVLPRLHAEKRSFDFAFIDGAHLFDGILLDFYYVDLLLDHGGYVLFHDAWMRATQMVVSFVRRNRKDYQRIRCPVRNLVLFQKIGRDERQWHHFRGFYTWKGLFSQKIITSLMDLRILQKLLRGKR